MNKRRDKKWFRLTWHPPDEELLAFVDGELTAKPASKVQKHLESCWNCRSRREKFERSICAFVSFRQTSLADSSKSPDQVQTRFSGKLSKLAAQFPELPQKRFRNGARFRRYLPQPIVWVSVVVLVTVGLVTWLASNRTVSASELLERAALAEKNQLSQFATPVVHRKLQVRRRSSSLESAEATDLETWRDSTNRRFAQRVIANDGKQSSTALPDVLVELERVFDSNHMDLSRAVTASAFQEWRRAIHLQSERVNETRLSDGEDALILTTNVAGTIPLNGIAQANLIVRTRDWHPVAQSLLVKAEGSEREYEINVLTSQLVNLSALDSSIFNESAVAVIPAVKTPSPTPLPTASPAALVSPTPSTIATTELELEVLERLDDAGALLGEQLSLTHTAEGRLLLQGIVETDARRNEILQALGSVAANSLVKIEIASLAEEIKKRQSQSSPREVKIQDAQVAQLTTPVETELRDYLAASRGLSGERLEDEVQRFSREMCSRSSRARAHALAVKQIAERFTPAQLGALDPADRRRLRERVSAHALLYQRQLQEMCRDLESIFSASSTKPVAPEVDITNDEGWLLAINRLFEMSAAVDRDLCQSFSLSTELVTAAAVKRASFWRSVADAESLATQIASWQ